MDLLFWRRPSSAGLKAIVGLGNPGREYADTRHNAGWWLVDRLRLEWRLGGFRREGNAAVAQGRVRDHTARLVKPLSYMNRSGSALGPLLRLKTFDPARDLLVVVDDVALDPGRSRLRASGSAGGHNGLKSVERALGSQEYARLRLGVGGAPPDADLSDWVLSPPTAEERELVESRFPDLVEGIELWMAEGAEAAMNRCNR